MKIKQPEMRVTPLAAAAAPAMASNALQVEDEFNAFYMTGTDGAAGHVLRPPYDPRVLERLTQENNVLGACIDAMVVNVAGTGHRIERETKRADEPDEQDDPVACKLETFFREPFPGTSFVTMRRDLARDMERVGYGVLEIMRNAAGEVVFLRNTPARTIRLCKLDAPAPVVRTVSRGGAEMSVAVKVRERRFVQLMAGQLLFFKEFGASRQLDKHTGQWESADRPVPVQARATELLYFQVGQDPNSPYGVPRWEGQIPSVVGSRAAEENNLTYLQSGGLPPALIVVQGGIVAGEARQALERQFAPGQKSRAAILEVPATDGMLDKPGTVKVTVERFGHERAGDSMFERYDDKCAERVLRAFRFSPLFLGKSADFNFATAYASYLAAESQVFGPERRLFDEIVTRKLLPKLGGAGYVFRSNPIAIKDVTQQIEALALAAGLPGIDLESVVDQLNKAAELELQFRCSEAPVQLRPVQSVARTGSEAES